MGKAKQIIILLSLIGLPQFCFASSTCSRNYNVGTYLGTANSQVRNAIFSQFFAELKKRIPCNLNEVEISPDRAQEQMRIHRIDAYAFSFGESGWSDFAKSEYFYSVESLLIVQKGLFKKGQPAKYYLDNPKIKFGEVSSEAHLTSDADFARLTKENRMELTAFRQGVFNLFRQKKIQAFFTTPNVYRRYLKTNDLNNNDALIPYPEGQVKICLQLSKKLSPQDQEMFAKALQDIKDDGTFQKIFLKWVSPEDFKTYYKF